MNTGNHKPAAHDAAGSLGDAFGWRATRSEHEASHGAAQARLASLRALAEIVSLGASEAATRESRERLHAATAAIFDAASIEWRALLCGRRA
jgi:hypothetical protein